jgi:hypothetical protein
LIASPGTESSPPTDTLLRLLERYRDLLATAQDEMLRRGIIKQIESLEMKLRGRDGAAAAGEAGTSRP